MSSCSCINIGTDSDSLECTNKKLFRCTHSKKCDECRKIINRGELFYWSIWQYCDYETDEYYGDAEYESTCIDCQSIRDEFFCNGFNFQFTWNDLKDHIDDINGELSSECLLRLTIGARNKVIDMIDELYK